MKVIIDGWVYDTDIAGLLTTCHFDSGFTDHYLLYPICITVLRLRQF